MASPIGHSLMGVTIYVAAVRSSEIFRRWKWLILCVIFAAIADVDFIPAAFGGIELANRLHRLGTHTILFAVAVTFLWYIIVKISRRKVDLKLIIILFICMLSHIVLDIFSVDTRPPIGVAAFKPFSDITLYAPVQIFLPIKKMTYSGIFSVHNIYIAIYEVLVFSVVIFIILGLKIFFESRRERNEKEI